MGFWGSLGKIIQGKPVYEPEQSEQQEIVQQAPTSSSGRKYIPEVVIERAEVRHDGARMNVDVIIQNNANVRLELDKIKLLGSLRELDTFLRPGEERKFRVYSGNRPNNPSNKLCEVWYRDETGDYFSAQHMIEFHKEPDNTYGIARIKFTPPVKDI